jgi:hypothetical protein
MTLNLRLPPVFLRRPYSTVDLVLRARWWQLEDTTLDSAALRNLLALKNKELRTVKKLAQTILDQRTEVEQYFLEALEQVSLPDGTIASVSQLD